MYSRDPLIRCELELLRIRFPSVADNHRGLCGEVLVITRAYWILVISSARNTAIFLPINDTTFVTCKSSMPLKAVEFIVRPLNPRIVSAISNSKF